MNGRRAFVVALLQTAALVAVVALQDPEVRRNIAWGIEWTRERLADILMGPGLPHASPQELREVFEAAEAITAEAAKGE